MNNKLLNATIDMIDVNTLRQQFIDECNDAINHCPADCPADVNENLDMIRNLNNAKTHTDIINTARDIYDRDSMIMTVLCVFDNTIDFDSLHTDDLQSPLIRYLYDLNFDT